MHSLRNHILTLLAFILSSAFALRSNPDSPCSVACGNVLGSTTGADIACFDREFGTTSQATVFKNCITCQLNSTYQDPGTRQPDLQWGLYNLRYAVSWCLYGYPNNTAVGSTPCYTSQACGPLESAFEYDSLSPNATAYGYCTLFRLDIVPKCLGCTAQGREFGAFFITNYITALTAACEQQPAAGAKLYIEGSLFSETRTNITSPTDVPDSFPSPSQGGLTLGAKVGISVAAILAALILTGCCIIWNGKRRRRSQLRKRQRESGYSDYIAAHIAVQRSIQSPGAPPQQSPGAFFDSPQSQKPLHGDPTWGMGVKGEESPQSTFGEKVHFSPYTSRYSSPVSATDQVQVVGREWPVDRKFSAGGTSGYGRPQGRSRSREKKGEEEEGGDKIEMQNVAPVLLHPHPPHGRGGNSGVDPATGQSF